MSRWLGAAAPWLLLPLAALAQLPRAGGGPLAERAFRHPDLAIPNLYRRADTLPPAIAAAARRDLGRLGVEPSAAFLDPRSGRWGTLLPATPLLPERAPAGAEERGAPLERTAAEALLRYLRARAASLRIAPAELAPPRVTVHDGGTRIQFHVGRVVGGVPVEGSYLTAVANHGNLVLLGARNWGTVDVATEPTVSADAARAALERHLAPHWPDAYRARPRLALLPFAAGGAPGAAPSGQGLRFRLVWVLAPAFASDPGRWEALVDAHDGELLAFDDRNRYASPRSVAGGVYPVSNDGAAPDGIEQPSWPMPFADVATAAGARVTDAGGNLAVCVEGGITTSLAGPFLGITDVCGEIAETSAGDLDLGAGPGIDCDVPEPGTSSPGNTHASRTAFYQLNRAQEAARALLPGNAWLRGQLGALVNLPDFGIPELNCNAFWDEVTVNFFDSGQAAPGIVCSNTGEIAGVLDHEWGHGLDDNDAVPTISTPGEGIADVYAALRLDESCIARGFFVTGSTCGDDDPCVACDGVRDVDWAKRLSGQPHDIAWIDAHCQPPILGDPGPCGGGVHCEGAVVGETVWDLVHRDLAAPPFDMDLSTALEVATRLTYLGAGGVGAWYQCVDGTGSGDGCNADGGYLNYLAIDDDNGDLADGTPHMSAIHAAFDRHGIACAMPPVADSGCAGAPATAPVVTATPFDRAAHLAWTAVPGAVSYQVLRTEGVRGCDFGKVKVAETTATEIFDGGLRNGLEAFYVVVPVGADAACSGPASACVAVTPQPGANLSLDPDSTALAFGNGDGDDALDNCEGAILAFDIVNVGSEALTAVTLLGAEAISHPGVVVTTPLPLTVTPALAPCAGARALLALSADGLAFNDTLELSLELTADELGGLAETETIRVVATESDLEQVASRTFTFETDLEGWQVVAGTFARSSAGGGAGGSAFHVASSSHLPDQCDGIRSPLIELSPTSTLSLWTHFDIEPPFILEDIIVWYDRANVGLVDAESGQRTPLSPDGGRAYNATGANGTCQTTNQDGWADEMASWAESTWSPAALETGTFAGRRAQLDLRYGTDVALEGAGFRFDEVTLTDFGLLGADAQPDGCPANGPPVAAPDAATTTPGTPVTIAVLANDDDPDAGDTLRALTVTDPPHGSATIDVVGPDLDTVTYTPDPGFGGADVFLYGIGDGHGGAAVGTISVDLSALFSDGFESGDTSAWGTVVD